MKLAAGYDSVDNNGKLFHHPRPRIPVHTAGGVVVFPGGQLVSVIRKRDQPDRILVLIIYLVPMSFGVHIGKFDVGATGIVVFVPVEHVTLMNKVEIRICPP